MDKFVPKDLTKRIVSSKKYFTFTFKCWRKNLSQSSKKIFNYLLVLSHGSDMLVEIWYDRKWVSIPWKWLECFYWILNREQEHFDICSGGKSLHEQQWGSKNLTSVAMKSIFQTFHILQKGFFYWQWIKLKKVIQSNRAT